MRIAMAFESPLGGDDPLRAAFELPLRAMHYPMGAPLEVASNSADVLAAAETVWGRFPQALEGEPARLHLAVARQVTTTFQPSAPRGREHMVSIVHSPENFAVADLARGYAFGWLTADVVRDHAYLRYHFLEPLAYLMLDALHFAPVHASSVALDGRAVVLCGPSGAGKTSLAYACARRGWSYLSDDATHVVRGRPGSTVAGRPHKIRFRESARLVFPELRSCTPVVRPNGKLDIEVETESLGLPIAYEARASHVVFLNRRGMGGSARIRPFPREDARRIFQQVVCYGDQRIRGEQMSTLERLAQLPTLELSYSDPGCAEAELRRLLA
jgi:hypothetical protein